MIESFSGTDDQLRQLVASLSYFMPRTMAFMWYFPLLTKGVASTFMKVAVGSVLILYPAYAVLNQSEFLIAAPSFGVLTFISEVLLGTLLGMTVAIPYYAFKAFGALVDVYRGATFAGQVTGNDTGEELPIEQLFGYLFVALILAGPGLHGVSVHLLNSYLIFPPGTIETVALQGWILTLMRMVADLVTFSVLLAGPVLLAILIVELAVEIISPFAQQLQVYNLQYGFRSIFGVAGLLVVMQYAETEIFGMFHDYGEQLNRLLGAIP